MRCSEAWGKTLAMAGMLVWIVATARGESLTTGTLPAELSVPREFVAVLQQGADIRVYGVESLARRRYSPCSTFKIVSTLMGLESGAVKGLETRLGYDDSNAEFDFWKGDLTLQEAFRVSCVPYYEKLVSQLDKSYVRDCLQHLDYGNCDLSAWSSQGHRLFWICSSLMISPLEQLEVEKRVLEGGSRFSPRHVALLMRCMKAGQVGPLTIYGKTGAGRNPETKRLEGWYVGFAEGGTGSRVYFAVHGADPTRDVTGVEMRKAVRSILRTWQ